jgi:hypothetical protein
MNAVLAARSYVWQKGEKWSLTFPNQHEHEQLELARCREMGLYNGPCTALLTQESGRKVEVELTHEWDYEPGPERRRVGPVIKLIPGAEQLPVEIVNGGVKGKEGVMYDPTRFTGVGTVWRSGMLGRLLGGGRI